MRLGVDFGTTRTVVACADRGNYPVVSFLDEAGDSQEWFPSVVAEAAEDPGELRFGFDALALSSDAGSVVRSFKRLLADPAAGPSTRARIGSVVLPMSELVTRFLVAVRQAIATRSNIAEEFSAAEPDSLRSVIAVPAHAHGAQRFVTLDAFRRAGFAPIAMLNEPSAAGFEFTHRHATTLTTKRDHVVVYDLGGGTFDASLVRMRGREHEILTTAGLSRLGGNDFDEALLELVLGSAKQTRSQLSGASLAALLERCREAKERLTPNSRKLSIDLDGASESVTIAVADYYEACGPLVERSLNAMAKVMARLEVAVLPQSSDLTEPAAPSNMAGIYVVGGASALPLVARLLRQRFGRRVHRSPYASAAVAIGLAIACDDAAGFSLSDQYARTFGVFREGAEGHEITFDPIFTSDTRVPAQNGAAVKCHRAYRAAHNIGHFRFLECSALGADGRPRGDIIPSGDILFPFDSSLRETSLDLAAVPVQRIEHAGTHVGPRIEEEYTLDEHGMVAVTIRNLDQDYQRVYRVGS